MLQAMKESFIIKNEIRLKSEREKVGNNEENCKQAKLVTVTYRDGKDKENVKFLHEADQVRVRQHHYL